MKAHRIYWSFVIAWGSLLGAAEIPAEELAPLVPSQQLEQEAIALEARQIAQAQTQRYALVIGNAAYEASPLRNPVNDARDMAAALQDLGFDVDLLLDATLPQIEAAIEQLNQNLRRGGIGMVFYAGHGIQVNGENYLMPIGANINREQDVRYEAYPLGRLLGSLEDADNDLNIVILDACRNNPFARQWRSSSTGLAPVQSARGTLVAYATYPGGLADDGPGRNGVYTEALLEHIRAPLNVELMLKQVRADVIEATNERQVPWESSSLVGNFSFNPEAIASPPATPSTTEPIGSEPATAPTTSPSERLQPSTTPSSPAANSPSSPVQTPPVPASGSLQTYNRNATFQQSPRFLDVAATDDTVGVTGSAYYFTIALPPEAGGSLQKIVIQQREGQNSIRYKEDVRAFLGTAQQPSEDLTLRSLAIDPTENTITIEFDSPIPPGETFTVKLRPVRNPQYDGVYAFGVTAFPAGDPSRGLYLGSKRLDFHPNDF